MIRDRGKLNAYGRALREAWRVDETANAELNRLIERLREIESKTTRGGIGGEAD